MADFIAFMTSPTTIAYIVILHVVFIGLQLMAAVMVYAERKVAAFMQQRYGPYLVGPKGLLQPIADILKLFFKEELRPKAADAFLFSLAPIISVTAAYLAFAPIPFGAPTDFFGLLPEKIALQVSDVNVAVLVIFAVASMGVYGIVLAGWASNSKYSLLGRPAQLRADDQLRACLRHGPGHGRDDGRTRCRCARSSMRNRATGSASFRSGTSSRRRSASSCSRARASPRPTARRSTSRKPSRSWSPAITPNTARCASPCSSWRNTSTWSPFRPSPTNLYLGGWHGPFIPVEYGWIWFVIKLAFLLFVYLWLRWTLPRFRYDQLMSFGWKVLLPVATVNLILTAAAVLYFGL